MARTVDIGDETNPRQVSALLLEMNAPQMCQSVPPDLVGLSIFTYGTHHCSVDNRNNATTLACGLFNSGSAVRTRANGPATSAGPFWYLQRLDASLGTQLRNHLHCAPYNANFTQISMRDPA